MIKLFAIILIIFLLTKQISNNYELKKVGNQWNRKQITYPNNPTNNIAFGVSISISNYVMAIGSPGNNGNSLPGRAYVFEKQNYNLIQAAQLPNNNNNQNGDLFGFSISISQDSSVILVGVPYANVSGNDSQGKVYVFTKSGNEWIQTKELTASDGQTGDNFGYSVSISERVILISSPFASVNGNSEQGKVYVWEGNDNGTIWQQKPTLTATNGQANDQFGKSLSISKNSSLIVIKSQQSSSQQVTAHIFQSNGTYWNEEENFTVNGTQEYDYGGQISISEDATTFVMGVTGDDYNQGKAYVFHYNGSNWNNQTIIPNNPSGKCCFGFSVSISQNNLLVGTFVQNTAYLFQNNGSGWNQERQLFPHNPVNAGEFGQALSISEDIFAISSPYLAYDGFDNVGGVYIYEFVYDQVNLLNCSSLFSSFDCYWNEILPITSDIEYQINYNYNNNEQWETIQSPILIDNIFFQIFNSSIYPNITGNVDYTIQIRVCNSTSQICGESSDPFFLTTRIDSVKNFTLESIKATSVMISWNSPNVPVINSIPKLDHYLLFYQKQDSNETKNVSISNSSTSYELTELDSLSNYSISICGCETYECLGNYQGEIVSTTILTKFGPVLNLQCSISNSFDISCYWDKPNDSINPSYYNFTYQAISENDNGNFDTNSTSQNFTAQYSNQNYQINVSACDLNEICGDISSIQIGNQQTSSQSSNSKTVIIVCSTIIPVVFIVGIILMIVLIRKKKKKKNREEENLISHSVSKDDQ
ncbi:hypothetical protein M0811_06211 [Anaeramoeba ignava]|uniref:Fibronectin type-III domain-containing protein n=1 Tax=Anaeramoeba ignava TaxID=1746090 RepID=A0A9Q0RDI2_ANAIG|nr:hypothetical protein M0811_06211 [Anaeramoeba ignava]